MIKDEFQAFYQSLLSLYKKREARHITHLVFEEVCGLSRLDLITKDNFSLPQVQQQILKEKLGQLIQHKPVQYVLGKCWFYRLPFYVNEHVLIPRPETEELAEWIIGEQANEKNNSGNKTLTILDAGTGSGCLAIALKNNIPDAHIIAIDISRQALQVAKQNALMNKADIEFRQRNMLEDNWLAGMSPLDIIVSNPPYIPRKEKQSMPRNVVSFEPHEALFVPDNDPLVFYKALIECGRQQLKAGGKFFMEIHEALGNSVINLFEKSGFENIQLRRDLNGRNRMVRVVKNCDSMRIHK